MRKFYFNFIVISLIFSCKPNTDKEVTLSIEKAIKEFPQLTNHYKLQSSSFRLTKSVHNGEFGFEIRLYQQPDSVGTEKLLVFTNDKNQSFAIPFFPNKYKDFWQFPFDHSDPKQTKITFETELNNVLSQLANKEDAERVRYAIVNELLGSVLNCKNLEEKDSLLVYKQIFTNTDIPVENGDSVYVRLRKNYEMMKKEWHPRQYQTNYNCYLDEKNYRIYQVNFKENKVEIKAYRQDQGFIYLNL